MKSSTLPSVRVEPALRDELESLLHEGETLSEFVEASVRSAIQRRRDRAEFISRGIRSLESARQTNDYVDADAVLKGLQRRLDSAKALQRKARKWASGFV